MTLEPKNQELAFLDSLFSRVQELADHECLAPITNDTERITPPSQEEVDAARQRVLQRLKGGVREVTRPGLATLPGPAQSASPLRAQDQASKQRPTAPDPHDHGLSTIRTDVRQHIPDGSPDDDAVFISAHTSLLVPVQRAACVWAARTLLDRHGKNHVVNRPLREQDWIRVPRRLARWSNPLAERLVFLATTEDRFQRYPVDAAPEFTPTGLADRVERQFELERPGLLQRFREHADDELREITNVILLIELAWVVSRKRAEFWSWTQDKTNFPLEIAHEFFVERGDQISRHYDPGRGTLTAYLSTYIHRHSLSAASRKAPGLAHEVPHGTVDHRDVAEDDTDVMAVENRLDAKGQYPR